MGTLLIAIALCDNSTVAGDCKNPLLEKANNPNLPDGIIKLTTPINLKNASKTTVKMCRQKSSCCSIADLNNYG